MNPVERLRDYIQQEHPQATVELTPPLHESGAWSLDIDLAEKKLAIEWSEKTGFGVSSVSADNFGERPNEAFKNLADARRRITDLLTTLQR